jgi:hypothetical protein
VVTVVVGDGDLLGLVLWPVAHLPEGFVQLVDGDVHGVAHGGRLDLEVPSPAPRLTHVGQIAVE